ncbi:ATP-binding protein, partial [Lentzea sp. NPDC060358]|uniref:ATP-binding protein n=1 Tax=Lentzea sp. NPDC060358 TaxID=3347103 RepID=UPI00365596E4
DVIVVVATLGGQLLGMVAQRPSFADEVTRVAREVGTEGILGGQARVSGVAGTWKDLTDSVNFMADNLTNQVRNIAQVTTAVARGDLTRKIDVAARGEILELKTTINTMVDQLSSFADEVTRVAREVGTEGKLGGQAEVDGVAGTWSKLTDNVNQLASNLTTQVRAIAAVATAVTAGDLTRQITVDASGELAELKDNVNQMIANLKETTRANREQYWLKTNLARLSGLMQGHRDLRALASLIMSELTPLVSAHHGAFFQIQEDDDAKQSLELTASYGFRLDTARMTRVAMGETLVGQSALEKKTILVTEVPGGYLTVSSALGESAPVNLVILPVLFQGETLGVIELASLNEFTEVHLDLLDQLKEAIGVNVNTMLANSRTDLLLVESQRLTAELRAGSEELEDRARQLQTASKYKSEFMANMSHELRTPLNSLLILAKLLADNLDGNLNAKQVEFARTIHSSGSDLLQLINDILDLTKVEAGHMTLHEDPVRVDELVRYVETLCLPLTAEKNLEFSVRVDPDVPETLRTDEHRLQQILRNLLSNAVKFTHDGGIRLHVRMDEPSTVAFDVHDTGIGIPAEKLAVIFEAFQQADGTTSRKYGGTGLGLSISRELAQLLNGALRVRSEPGIGSTFTLCLPLGKVVSEAVVLPEPTPIVTPAPVLAASGSIRFHGEKVLVVDDDLRNVFALTSVLELHGLEAIYADNGITGVRALEQYDDVAIVLMDIMMPELDGNATISAIRAMERYSDLPVIAVTAKAMKGDREKSLSSGATDYVAKPVDTEHLIRLIAYYLGVSGDA